MASHMSSKGGVSSSYTTVNNGLSQRVMAFGSSYRNTRFSKSSGAYPLSFVESASNAVLFSRHFSTGEPTWTYLSEQPSEKDVGLTFFSFQEQARIHNSQGLCKYYIPRNLLFEGLWLRSTVDSESL
jgi:hypothetical protein